MSEAVLSPPSENADTIRRRAAARLRLSIPVRLMTIYEMHNCVLLDLSRSGAKIGLAVPPPMGDVGHLRIGPVEVFGEAARRMPGAGRGVNGIAFDGRLSHAAVLVVRQHAGTFQRTEGDAFRQKVRLWVTGDK